MTAGKTQPANSHTSKTKAFLEALPFRLFPNQPSTWLTESAFGFEETLCVCVCVCVQFRWKRHPFFVHTLPRAKRTGMSIAHKIMCRVSKNTTCDVVISVVAVGGARHCFQLSLCRGNDVSLKNTSSTPSSPCLLEPPQPQPQTRESTHTDGRTNNTNVRLSL